MKIRVIPNGPILVETVGEWGYTGEGGPTKKNDPIAFCRCGASTVKPFCDGIRQFTKFNMSAMYRKPRAIMNPLDYGDLGMAMLPYLMPVMKWSTLSAGEFAKRFKSPFLRKAIPQIFSWDEAPVMMGLSLLAYMYTGNAGFPVGGSLEFARSIERRFLDLGGEIFYKSQVEKILVENDCAVGVRLYNDEVHRGDNVISACDGRGTIFDMLDGVYVDQRIRKTSDGHGTTTGGDSSVVAVRKGESFSHGGITVTFLRFDMAPKDAEAMAAGEGFPVGAVLRVEGGSGVEELTAVSVFGAGKEPKTRVVSTRDGKVGFEFLNMSVNMEGGGSMAQLRVLGSADAHPTPAAGVQVLVVEASVKPVMSLVWVAAFLVLAGLTISIVNARRQEPTAV